MKILLRVDTSKIINRGTAFELYEHVWMTCAHLLENFNICTLTINNFCIVVKPLIIDWHRDIAILVTSEFINSINSKWDDFKKSIKFLDVNLPQKCIIKSDIDIDATFIMQSKEKPFYYLISTMSLYPSTSGLALYNNDNECKTLVGMIAGGIKEQNKGLVISAFIINQFLDIISALEFTDLNEGVKYINIRIPELPFKFVISENECHVTTASTLSPIREKTIISNIDNMSIDYIISQWGTIDYYIANLYPNKISVILNQAVDLNIAVQLIDFGNTKKVKSHGIVFKTIRAHYNKTYELNKNLTKYVDKYIDERKELVVLKKIENTKNIIIPKNIDIINYIDSIVKSIDIDDESIIITNIDDINNIFCKTELNKRIRLWFDNDKVPSLSIII